MLCAALQEKYVLRDIVPTADRKCAKAGILYTAEVDCPDLGSDGESGFPSLEELIHATIDFTAYKDFQVLDHVKDVELLAKRSDDLPEFTLYPMGIDGGWRMRQGRVLDVIGESMAISLNACRIIISWAGKQQRPLNGIPYLKSCGVRGTARISFLAW